MIIVESPAESSSRILWQDIADARRTVGDLRAIYRRHALREIARFKQERREEWRLVQEKAATRRMQFAEAAE